MADTHTHLEPASAPAAWSDYPRELTMYGSIPHTGRVHVAWSLAIGLFLWAVQWVDGRHAPGPLQGLVVTLLHALALGYWCWLLIGMAWLTAVRRRWPRLPDARQRYELGGVYSLLPWSTLITAGLLCVPVATALGLFTAHTALGWFMGPAEASAMTLPYAKCLVLATSLALSTFTVDYLRVRLAANQARAEAAQRQALEAQLQRLQAQLEPHMLFNTLANLHVLIGSQPARAQDMLNRLIAFLRSTLQASQRPEHSLAQEFTRADDYLALMKVRMGARLDTHLALPPELADARVPPLIVQPLLENAIQHGLEPSRKGGLLQLQASAEGGRLRITVLDTGQGLAAAARTPRKEGGGVGLHNVRERLRSLYGTQAELQLVPGPGGSGTLASLDLPLRR
jgi:signal transduction histidine kinase